MRRKDSPSQPTNNPSVISLQQNVIPDYRIGFLRTLKAILSEKLLIHSGLIDFSPTTRTAAEAEPLIHSPQLTNRYFLNRRFLWQSGSFRKRLQADLLILNFNLRNLSNYPILLLRRLFRRPSLLWGHVSGLSPLTERFGFLQLFFAKGFICYTEAQQKKFRELHPKSSTQTFVAANSCIHELDCYALEVPHDKIRDIIYVGRLVKEKKPGLLLQAFLLAKEQKLIPREVRLIIVGRGPESEKLQSIAAGSAYSDCIHFRGHIANIDELREIYSTAYCSVNPGYIGLSVIQSFAFGVPVLAARDEPHSPEVEACHKMDFGCFFPSDSVSSLTQELSRFWQRKEQSLLERPRVLDYIRKHYTFETMADGFIQAIHYALKIK